MLCECGCGGTTELYPTTRKSIGYVKGQPKRFIRGHQIRVSLTPESRKKQGLRIRGEDHPLWNPNRQWYKRTFGKKDHRLIAEKVLGRPFKQNEIVHHVNENKQDNRHSNLVICTRTYHGWLHKRIAERRNHAKI